jgi:hypothetical protein
MPLFSKICEGRPFEARRVISEKLVPFSTDWTPDSCHHIIVHVVSEPQLGSPSFPAALST